MKKNRIRILKKYSAALWLTAALFMFTGSAVYAAYTYQNSAKRVISTQTSDSILFSSNIMSSVGSEHTETFNSFGKYNYSVSNLETRTETFQILVTVCNYPQNNMSRVNENNIKYKLHVLPCQSDGTAVTGSYSFSLECDGESAVNFGSSGYVSPDYAELTGKSTDQNIYRITVPADFARSGDCLWIKAVPEKTSYTGNLVLGRRIVFSDVVPPEAGWKGEFTDTLLKSDPYNPKELYGFNYRISGSGTGTVSLRWDPEYVELCRSFIKEKNLTPVTDNQTGEKYVTFTVDSSVQQYMMQFYRVKETEKTETVSAVQNYVSFSFTASGNQ